MMNIKQVKFFDKKSALHGNKFASCAAVKSEIILRKFEKFCRKFEKRKVYFYRQYMHLMKEFNKGIFFCYMILIFP